MGERFQFPLQKVLEFREAKKNSDASKLSQSKNKLLDEKHKLDHIEEEKGKVIQNDSENESVSIHHLKVSSDYIVQLNDNMIKQGKIIKIKEETVESDHQKLLEAARDKKAVEILRDKQKTNFDRKMKKQELKFNNEKASRIIHHKKKGDQ